MNAIKELLGVLILEKQNAKEILQILIQIIIKLTLQELIL